MMEKHFDLDIQDAALTFSVNEQRVAAEAALDGLYVIRTSVTEADMTAEAAVLNYKRLAEVERAFRTLKGVDLHVRPIRHRRYRGVDNAAPPVSIVRY
jgi:transposase